MVSLRLTLDILHLLTSLFITLTSASPINPDIIPGSGSSSPLQVSISPGDANAVVTIAVTNTGPKDLQIMNLGTFLYESAAIEKLDISYAGMFPPPPRNTSLLTIRISREPPPL